MAKELGKGAKIAVWIGVLATVGISGWAIHQFLYKPWKAKRDSENEEKDQDVNLGIGNGTTNPPPATTPTISNFDKLKAKLDTYSGTVTNYGTFLIYKTSPVNLGINATQFGFASPSDVIKVKFTNGARWALFKGDVKVSNRINEGEYQNGGEWIKVYTGKNAGVITTDKSVVKNIVNTIK